MDLVVTETTTGASTATNSTTSNNSVTTTDINPISTSTTDDQNYSNHHHPSSNSDFNVVNIYQQEETHHHRHDNGDDDFIITSSETLDPHAVAKVTISHVVDFGNANSTALTDCTTDTTTAQSLNHNHDGLLLLSTGEMSNCATKNEDAVMTAEILNPQKDEIIARLTSQQAGQQQQQQHYHDENDKMQPHESVLTMMPPMQPGDVSEHYQQNQHHQLQQYQHHQLQLQQHQLQLQDSTTSMDPTSILSSNLSADVVSTAAAAAAAYVSLLPDDAEDIVHTQQIAQMNNMIQGQGSSTGGGDSMTSGSSLVCGPGNSISGSDGDGGDSREQNLASRRLKDRERYASMSEDQREEYNHKRREQYHRQSEDSRKRRRERERDRYHSLPPDKAKERNVRRAMLERERYKRLSAEELAARNAKRRARAAAMRTQKRAAHHHPQQQQQPLQHHGGQGASSLSSNASTSAHPAAAGSLPMVKQDDHDIIQDTAGILHASDSDPGQLYPAMMGMVLPLEGMDGSTNDMACTDPVNLSNSTLFQQHHVEASDNREHYQQGDDQNHHETHGEI
eukprot:CAMPEP_0176480364 /NCGR_PEP_ID=MMETSP0200_2-20121128/2237_1 /TAXON_ID=947934 /ORGANISM="Chaetoceros sp., Strain GSL56" /LENGTH=563 /DNA_ID=CAMNT_0017876477 /DNA_START=137 /DNA_END=1828 /DNA_ORIENTATION=+